MADDVLPKVGDVIAGKYRIERLLGGGGMGSVYEVVHRVTGKHFAVKWLLPDLTGSSEAVKRFIREAQVAGRFEHPNVVQVYDVGKQGGSFYMVMELLNGESLAERLARRGRISAREACALIIPCLRGVARAHEAGIVHCDLKPDNIFLCAPSEERPEQPKVLDFGISKMSALKGGLATSFTQPGIVMGTPHYMAPEQVRGRNVDHRVDIYAFGVILRELVSGRLPFDGETYSDLAIKVATEVPAPLGDVVPGLSPALVAIVERAMARHPDKRFASLNEMASALEQLIDPSEAVAAAAGRAATGDSGRPRQETPLTSETQAVTLGKGLRRSSAGPFLWTLGAFAVAGLGLATLAENLSDNGAGASHSREGVGGIQESKGALPVAAKAGTGRTPERHKRKTTASADERSREGGSPPKALQAPVRPEAAKAAQAAKPATPVQQEAQRRAAASRRQPKQGRRQGRTAARARAYATESSAKKIEAVEAVGVSPGASAASPPESHDPASADDAPGRLRMRLHREEFWLEPMEEPTGTDF